MSPTQSWADASSIEDNMRLGEFRTPRYLPPHMIPPSKSPKLSLVSLVSLWMSFRWLRQAKHLLERVARRGGSKGGEEKGGPTGSRKGRKTHVQEES